jgi:hypothetical protein
MALPRHFPFAAEADLVQALKNINEAQLTGSTPNSIGSGDFNVSLTNQQSLGSVERKIRHDLYACNPDKYGTEMLKTTVVKVRVASSFDL